jgi:GT2 family glycosyltransferase
MGARTSSAEFLVFVNPDMRPTAADFAELVQDVATDPACAASAATRVDDGGAAQMNGGWEPSLGRTLVHAVGAHKLFPQAGLFATPTPGEAMAVDWVSGACMAVRRETFAELGCFDEAFYLYCEDVAFSRTAREHGLQVRLRTDVLVRGADGASGAPSMEMARLRGAFQTRYARRYHAWPAALAISGLNALGYGVRALRERSRGQRDLARAYWAYVKGAVTARATVAGRVVTG